MLTVVSFIFGDAMARKKKPEAKRPIEAGQGPGEQSARGVGDPGDRPQRRTEEKAPRLDPQHGIKYGPNFPPFVKHRVMNRRKAL